MLNSMKMKKKINNRTIKYIIFMLVVFLLSGCGKNTDRRINMYYINAGDNGFELVEFNGNDMAVADMVAAVIKEFNESESKNHKSPFVFGIEVKEVYIEGATVLIYTDDSIDKLSKSERQLIKASLTMTLTQIDGIDSINIVAPDGNETGKLYADSFVIIQ